MKPVLFSGVYGRALGAVVEPAAVVDESADRDLIRAATHEGGPNCPTDP